MAVHSSAPTETVRASFERWLAARQDGAAVAETVMAARGRPGRNLLVEAGWQGESHRLVLRLTAETDSSAGHADTRCQFLTLQRLRAQLHRPAVPRVLWWEGSAEALGAPFLVMNRVEGRTADEGQMPYTFGSWISEASPAARSAIQRNTVEELARVHAATPADFWFLDRRRPGETPLSAHLRGSRELYRHCPAVPLIDRGFDWLHRHWPEGASTPVLCWGDARVGNVVYRDFTPVALLDWELATLAPRELDLGCLIFAHRFLDDRASSAGLPGLPDMFRPADVAATYAEVTGYRPTHLDFYVVYAAVTHAVLAVRRHLLGAAATADRDAMIPHHQTLAALLDGRYPTVQSKETH